MIIFLDIEASSLSPTSYPIELGWVDEQGRGESLLIHPAPGWTEWSTTSERLHGISRAMLREQGVPYQVAAERFLAAANRSRVTLVSDSPAWDGHWLRCLLDAAELEASRSIRVRDVVESYAEACRPLLQLRVALGSAGHAARERQMRALVAHTVAEAQLAHAHRHQHRALPDAERLWHVWREVRERVARELKQRHDTNDPGC